MLKNVPRYYPKPQVTGTNNIFICKVSVT